MGENSGGRISQNKQYGKVYDRLTKSDPKCCKDNCRAN